MAKEHEPMSATQSIKYVKDLLKSGTIKMKPKDFKPGSVLMFYYNAKDKIQTYDKTPMGMVLRRNKTHTLFLNLHWAPIPMRVILVKKIISLNRANIKAGKPMEFDYKTLRPFLKRIGFSPVIRLYINNRISKKGVQIPQDQFMNVARTRTESFTSGKVSAEELYKKAIKGNKKYRSTRKRRQ